MLNRLSISNYTIISSLSIDLNEGFSVITGETGAGKSILLDALGFVMGNRADSNVLFDNTRKCVVEAIFILSDDDMVRLTPFFNENDIDIDKECIVRRELNPQKKSRAFINDTPVPLQTLKRLGTYLVDIHSQHDSLLLCDPDFQLTLLDDAANNRELLTDYKTQYRLYSQAKNELAKLKQQSINNIGENDYLRFQLDELLRAELVDDEYDDLTQRIEYLENQEEINRLLMDSANILEDSDSSLLDGLNLLINNVNKLTKYIPQLDSVSERLHSTKIELKDICSDLNNMRDDSHDVSSLEMLQNRFDTIQHLMMKHHINDYNQLLVLREEIRSKVDEFSNIDDTITEKERHLKFLENELTEKADELNKRRMLAKTTFETEVTKIIRQLSMPYGVFEINCKKTADLTINGTDEVTFMFSANKGFAPDNMAKAASGGELSRLMLAIKSVAAGNNYIPTLIFDEIDTGVSGEVASKIADIMKEMSNTLQLISITHLPQIASKAENHLFVYKNIEGDKTNSNIRILSKEERITEIAKMLSNDKITAEALKAAEVLITQ